MLNAIFFRELGFHETSFERIKNVHLTFENSTLRKDFYT